MYETYFDITEMQMEALNEAAEIAVESQEEIIDLWLDTSREVAEEAESVSDIEGVQPTDFFDSSEMENFFPSFQPTIQF